MKRQIADVLMLAAAAASLAGCGGSTSAATAETAAASARESTPPAPSSRHEALAPLRPAGTEEALEGLERDPGSARAHARAAISYAPTDAAGMAILWGLTRAAMSPDALDEAEVAAAMVSVLRERAVVTREGSRGSVSVRFAPGAVPAFEAPDGSVSAPVAHVFEMMFAPALAIFDGEWSLHSIAAVLGLYVTMLERGSPLDSYVELHRWLVRLAAGGHLEAFVHAVFGPAFPDERTAYDAARVDAMRAHVRENPLRPTHAVLPDHLVRIR